MSESSTSPAAPSRMVQTPVVEQPQHVNGSGTSVPTGTQTRSTKKTKQPRQPQQTKQPRTIPPWVTAGKPAKKGPRLMAWYLYLWCRMYKLRWIPQPRPYGTYVFGTLRKVKSVRALRQSTMAIVSVVTTKGGATKTTVVTWLAAVLQWIYKLAVVVFDIDTGGGKAAGRYGLDPEETFESRKAIELISSDKWDPDYEDLVPNLKADSETGVMVFHCVEIDDEEDEPVWRSQTEKALPKVKKACHTLVVDTPPGFGKSITVGALHASYVTCVVGRNHSEEEMGDITKTLNHKAYGLRDEDREVLVVVSGVRWFKFNTRTQYEYAELFGIEPERLVLMPYVGHLYKVRGVSINKLGPKALFAQVNLAEAVAKAAQRYNVANPPSEIGAGSHADSQSGENGSSDE